MKKIFIIFLLLASTMQAQSLLMELSGKKASAVTYADTAKVYYVDATSGSDAINAGIDVGLTQDILGNPIVGNPDIGAYEKQ